jgi:hypothetical protein
MVMSLKLTKLAMAADDSSEPKIGKIDDGYQKQRWAEIDKFNGVG